MGSNVPGSLSELDFATVTALTSKQISRSLNYYAPANQGLNGLQPSAPLLAQPGNPTLLEVGLPIKELSYVAEASRRTKDPVYGSHRWWARRPPLVMRGLLLASALSSTVNHETFWTAFSSDQQPLTGLRIHDPFLGGGSTLVEAARLGAESSGTDIDPLAVELTKHELETVDAGLLHEAVFHLTNFLENKARLFYDDGHGEWTPVHFFYLHEVSCPSCSCSSPLYKDVILARGSGKDGSVIRDTAIVAFCPICYSIHQLSRLDRKELRCCNKRFRLEDGNYAKGKFICPHCKSASSHSELQTGTAPLRLLAVEETATKKPRRIRAPDEQDLSRLERALLYLDDSREELQLPTQEFSTNRQEAKPVSFGLKKVVDLFTSRQLILFGNAFNWLNLSDYPAPVKRALSLGISSSLTTNNLLCGYARDYGRLAPLFSVRSYSIPTIPVELNAFHPSAGRGTIYRHLARIEKALTNNHQRHTWSVSKQKVEKFQSTHDHRSDSSDVACLPSSLLCKSDQPDVDICIFDPPYFDFIAYSELSEFYRHWLDLPDPPGNPLLPSQNDPVESFAQGWASNLAPVIERLKPGRLMAFTFHSTSRSAWDAVAIGLDRLQLTITAMWPVKTDTHMGHHTAEGNCEWDIVVVCRRSFECEPVDCNIVVESWVESVDPIRIRKSDRVSMEMAVDMAKTMFGRVKSDLSTSLLRRGRSL